MSNLDNSVNNLLAAIESVVAKLRQSTEPDANAPGEYVKGYGEAIESLTKALSTLDGIRRGGGGRWE